ncbi:hypothetical protein A3K71_06065 [archaeon RBG_16_50_20]|nr:MAG: hypothetical protein A3K71_06065 [archaeon RBG_16_50_20]
MRTPTTKSRRVAMAAVLAAVYFVLRSLPNPVPFLFQMIGISGRFTAGDFLLTTIVLVAGLWGGVLSVLIGTILAYPVSGTPFLGLDFLPGVANVLLVGLVLQNRRRIAQGIYAAILLAFLLSPYSLLFGYGYVPYAWLHILGLAVLFSPIIASVPTWLTRNDTRQLAAVAALAFVGTMAQHLTGGLLYEFTVGLVQGNTTEFLRKSWQIIFWLYPAERLIIVLVSTLISAGLLRSIKRLSL